MHTDQEYILKNAFASFMKCYIRLLLRTPIINIKGWSSMTIPGAVQYFVERNKAYARVPENLIYRE
jgi:hypothetical protein